MNDTNATLVADFPELQLPDQLPDKDGIASESPWHHAQISLLIDTLAHHWREREDFFIGGNMFFYFSRRQLRNQDFVGPDFFYVPGVERRRPRRYWAVWDEDGKYPDLIIELLSPTPAETDRTIKKALYEQTFHTREYYCYDPDARRLEGWRLEQGVYRDLQADARGWLWSEVLQLWLGEREGDYLGRHETWLRLFDVQGNMVLHPTEEARAKLAEVQAEVARLRALLAEKGISPTP